MTEHDSKGSRTYRMLSGPVPMANTITLDLVSLEELVARYDLPHFWQRDYERITKHGYSQNYIRWTLHIIHLPNGVMVVAYEKSGEQERVPVQIQEGVD